MNAPHAFSSLKSVSTAKTADVIMSGDF